MLRDAVPQQREPRATHARDDTKWEKIDPELLVDWLDYSEHLTNQGGADEPIDKAATLMARTHPSLTSDDIKEHLQKVGRTSLQRARVRMDIVAMLLHRLLMAWYRLNELAELTLPCFYLYFDASPQRWGVRALRKLVRPHRKWQHVQEEIPKHCS